MLYYIENMFKLVVCLLFIQQSLAYALDGRIVGGKNASIYDYPYQVSVEHYLSHQCGGSIISPTWILTAGHCVRPRWPGDYTVRIGTSNFNDGGQVINVTKIIRHDNFSNEIFDYNIALMQLDTPIELSETAQVITLAENADSIVEGAMANVTGWGPITRDGNKSSILQVMEVPILEQDACKTLYKDRFSERMFCAGSWMGYKDVCSNDLGSPLVVDSVLVGVVSFRVYCARPALPGIYTSVGVLRDWITEHSGI